MSVSLRQRWLVSRQHAVHRCSRLANRRMHCTPAAKACNFAVVSRRKRRSHLGVLANSLDRKSCSVPAIRRAARRLGGGWWVLPGPMESGWAMCLHLLSREDGSKARRATLYRACCRTTGIQLQSIPVHSKCSEAPLGRQMKARRARNAQPPKPSVLAEPACCPTSAKSRIARENWSCLITRCAPNASGPNALRCPLQLPLATTVHSLRGVMMEAMRRKGKLPNG